MQEYDVPPRELPTLILLREGRASAYLQPRVLWVVGTNGRVDLVHGDERYLLVDVADNFDRPKWQAARPWRRTEREALNRDWLEGVLQ